MGIGELVTSYMKKDIDHYKLVLYIVAQIFGGLFALAFYNSVKNNSPKFN